MRIEEILGDSRYKFRTAHRDDIYHNLAEIEKSGIFKSVTDTFLCAFAVGYHFDKDSSVKGGNNVINHVNLTSVPNDVRELLLRLVYKRFPSSDAPDKIWSKVEEYAEMGIQIINNSIIENNSMLIIDDIMEQC